MGDWEPDRSKTITDCVSWCTALLWIVPAKVQGTWQTPDGALTLEQQFRRVTGLRGQNGDLVRGASPATSSSSRWARFTTRAASPPARLRGTVSGARSGAWRATRQ